MLHQNEKHILPHWPDLGSLSCIHAVCSIWLYLKSALSSSLFSMMQAAGCCFIKACPTMLHDHGNQLSTTNR